MGGVTTVHILFVAISAVVLLVAATVKNLAMTTVFVIDRNFSETISGPCFSDMMATARQQSRQSSRVKNVGPSRVRQAMRDNTMWGGGGEVVGLTHVLKRPIHVYELQSTGRR